MASGKTIAIVGGGFCGVVTAVHLLRSSAETIGQIILIEKRPQVGRGVAYGTTDSQHLLNVPAGRMSALVHDDDNFVRFLRQTDAGANAESFASRITYGRYLESLLNDAIRQRAAHITFRIIHDTVVDIKTTSEDRAELILEHGPTMLANAVVIANGNLAIRQPTISAGIHNSSRYISDPWAADALARIDPLQDTLLLGAGLTAVDVACSLTKMTYRPLIHMVSRHGLQAQRFHADGPTPHSAAQIDIPPHYFRTMRRAVKAVRQQIQVCAEQGHNWRDVFTALRSKTAGIWQALPDRERSTFLRHVQPYWDIHRHRVSPDIADRIDRHAARGEITRHAGRVVNLIETSAGIVVTIRARGSKAHKELLVGSVINCTGQCNDVSTAMDPLMSNLHQRGLLLVDPLRIGIQCTDDYTLIDTRGASSKTLYYVGPLLRAKYWEATAVPDLKHHTAGLVRSLLSALAITPRRSRAI